MFEPGFLEHVAEFCDEKFIWRCIDSFLFIEDFCKARHRFCENLLPELAMLFLFCAVTAEKESLLLQSNQVRSSFAGSNIFCLSKTHSVKTLGLH